MLRSRKGFVIIMTLALTAVVLIVASVIINLGCGEALQVRKRNDAESAYYLAVAGAERMYARLRSVSNALGTPSWPVSISSTTVVVGSKTIGQYAVTANLTGEAGEFMVVSDGTVNGRTVRVTTKYGFTSLNTNGIPIGSMGSMDLLGSRWWFLTSWVYAEGPLVSASTITPNSNTNSRYVQYSGTITENDATLARPSFWLGTTFDTNANGDAAIDSNTDGQVSEAEAIAQNKLGAFEADDTNGDNVVTDKDAFIYYYTVHLNNPANNSTGASLGIEEDGVNYYSGDHTFGPFNVPAGTRVIFVDGDASVVFNAQKWWGSDSDLTIVSTGDITIVQPVNGADDRLTLVAYGNTMTGGLNLGDLADVDGNLVSYSGGYFEAVLGGSTNGSIFADDYITAHTGLPSFLFNRDFNKGTDDWSGNEPIGLPPNFAVRTFQFRIKGENLGEDTVANPSYMPRWQRR